MLTDMHGVELRVGDEIEGKGVYTGFSGLIGEISDEAIAIFHDDKTYNGGVLLVRPRSMGKRYSWLLSTRDLKSYFIKGGEMRIAAFTELADGTYIKPITDGDGVVLIACDKRGNAKDRGTLARITSRGLSLTEGISPDLGIPIDSKGRLMVI